MNKALLKKSVETLYVLRSEIRDKVDVSTIQKLDDAISTLENCFKQGGINSQDAVKVLTILGVVLERLPDIEKLIRLFLG